jgi:hypothetical protein
MRVRGRERDSSFTKEKKCPGQVCAHCKPVSSLLDNLLDVLRSLLHFRPRRRKKNPKQKKTKFGCYFQQNKEGRRSRGIKKCHAKTMRGKKSRYN